MNPARNEEPQIGQIDQSMPMPGQPVDMGNGEQMVLQDDGSALFLPAHFNTSPSSFDANLADNGEMKESELSKIGAQLCEAIEDDIQSRMEWSQSLATALDQLNLKPEVKAFPFQNASNFTSDVMMQVLITTVTNVMAELFPAEGPAKDEIVGDEGDELTSRAERVVKFINLYLTQINKEYYLDKEQMFMWGVLNGSAFSKTYFDPVYEKVITRYIRPQDFVVNYGTRSLETCNRMTQILEMSPKDMKLRQLSGFYRDLKIAPFDDLDGNNDITERYDSIQGSQREFYEYNKMYTLYECHVDLDLKGYEHLDDDGEPTGVPLPYIVTIDKESQKILSIYRNWSEDDEFYKRINCFTHYPYLPSMGFYAFGLIHVASGNAEAATQLGRMIINGGMLSNFPGGVRVKGLRMEDNNIRIGPTEFIEIDTGGMKISDAIMPMPYKEPSPMMMQLKQDLEDSIRKMAGAADNPVADFNTNAPVGTTLALMEEAHRMQSGVIRRYHRALGEELGIIYRLFGEYLPDKPYPYLEGNQNDYVMSQDFKPDLKIIPVSNPNIMTTAQRLIQNEGMLRIAQQSPELFDLYEINRRILVEMKVPNIDKVLKKPEEPTEPMSLDPLSENVLVLQGQPIVATPGQDHNAHFMVHQMAIDDFEKQLAANPQDPTPMQAIQILKMHNMNHEILMYSEQVVQEMDIPIEDPAQLAMDQLPPEVQNVIAGLEAQRAAELKAQQEEELAGQGAPVDPGRAMLEDVRVKEKGIDIKAELETARLDLDKTKLELEMMKLQQNNQIEELKIQIQLMQIKNKQDMEEVKNKFEAAKDMKELSLKEESFLAKQHDQLVKASQPSEPFNEGR